MSKVAIQGAATGTGVFTLASPATNTNRTLVLPDEAGTVLTSASNLAGVTGVGKVLQAVMGTYAVQTDFSTASYVDTGLTATITPSSTSSKILVLVNQSALFRTAGSVYGEIRLARDASLFVRIVGEFQAANGGSGSTSYLDSPNTTSAVIYKTQCFASGATMQLQRNSSVSTIVLLEIAA